MARNKLIVTSWANSNSLQALEVLFGIGIFLISNWLIINILITSIQTAATIPALANAMILVVSLLIIDVFLLASLGIMAIDFVKEKNRVFETIGWGKSNKKAIYALVSGLGFTFIMMFIFGQGFFVVPFAAMSASLASTNMMFLFIPILFAAGETIFFRSTIIPTLGKSIGAIPAIILGSVIFAVFHWAVYGAGIGLMIGAFIMSICWSYFNSVWRSTLFEMSSHISWNILVVLSIAMAVV